jgi:hypothetical protein
VAWQSGIDTPHDGLERDPCRWTSESQSAVLQRTIELLSPEVVFNSPVVFRPYHARKALGVIVRAVLRVFEDFDYEREIASSGWRRSRERLRPRHRRPLSGRTTSIGWRRTRRLTQP